MTIKLTAKEIKELDAYRKELKAQAASHIKHKTTPDVIAVKPDHPGYGRGCIKIKTEIIARIDIYDKIPISEICAFFNAYKDVADITLDTSHESNDEYGCDECEIKVIKNTAIHNPLLEEMMKIWNEENDLFQVQNQINIKEVKYKQVEEMKRKIVKLEKELKAANNTLKNVEKE